MSDLLRQTEKSRRGALDDWEHEAADGQKMIERKKEAMRAALFEDVYKRPAEPIVLAKTLSLRLQLLKREDSN